MRKDRPASIGSPGERRKLYRTAGVGFRKIKGTGMPQLLSIDKLYYRRGGADASFFRHKRLFEQTGWRFVPFPTHDPRNERAGRFRLC